MPIKSNRLLAMLKDDHKVLKSLFREYEKADLRKQLAIAQLVVQELDIHVELEEQLVYPVIREEIAANSLLNKAFEEHHLMHILIDKLFSLKPSEEIFHATFMVLGDVVKHHIKEEESRMFPQAQKSKIDWERLYIQALRLRQQLLVKLAA